MLVVAIEAIDPTAKAQPNFRCLMGQRKKPILQTTTIFLILPPPTIINQKQNSQSPTVIGIRAPPKNFVTHHIQNPHCSTHIRAPPIPVNDPSS